MVNNNNLNVLEKNKINRRRFIFGGLLSLPFFGLIGNLWNIQVTQKKYFQELSRGNRIRLINTAAPRGVIYDRNHIVYAKNQAVFNLAITIEDCPDIEKTIKKLANTLTISYQNMMIQIHKSRTASFVPIVIAKDISWRQLSIVISYQEEFPGININHNPRREYPLGVEASHLLGYMSRINEKQLKFIDKKRVQSAQIIGQDGLEFYFNDLLVGYDGGRQVEVDSIGREIKVLQHQDPIPGNSIRLTIDHDLQQFSESKLVDKRGAIIISDPNTGEILTLASSPQFDPNLFSKELNRKQWLSIVNSKEKILTNRCIQGLYSPGSTIKMLIALCGLELGMIDENFVHHCKGYYRHGRTVFHCWKRSGHGEINTVEAISQSCNSFFYNLGSKIGIKNIVEFAQLFGLGQTSEITLDGESAGIFPSPEWKFKKVKQAWYPGDTINLSIGQGFVSTTPIQMLVYLNTILNNGQIIPLVMTKDIIQPKNTDNVQKWSDLSARKKQQHSKPNKFTLNQKNLDIIKTGMIGCIQGKKGTARSANLAGLSLAGKTGSTQVVSNKTKQKYIEKYGEINPLLEDHAWFVGYAPAENPQVSISILIENGKSGTRSAILARDILSFYLKTQQT